MSQRLKQNKEAAFALIWVSALTIIFGMASVMAVKALEMTQSQGQMTSNLDNIDEVISILEVYQRVHHKLPCPASRTEPQNSANYGIARTACDTPGSADGTHTVAMAEGAGHIRIGVLPTRTLGIPDEQGADPWGNRLLYAVTEELTDPFTFSSSAGVITISDGSVDLTNEAGYILIAMGPDKLGAYSAVTGKLTRGCSSSLEEVENCDDDATFLLKDYEF